MENLIRSICSYGWTVTFTATGVPASADYKTRSIVIALDAPCSMEMILRHEYNHLAYAAYASLTQ